jgi:hypothetical protein
MVGKLEGKRSVGQTRNRGEDNTRMDLRELREVVRTGVTWLRTDNLEEFCGHGNEPPDSIKCC